MTLLLSSVSYQRVFACRTDIYCCSLITLSAWWNLLCMPTPCQIKYPEKPPIISLQAKQMCVYQQSGCAVVFSMWKLQLKEIGSEPGIKSTGCLWVVLPILFSCCVCLCLHFGKLNSLVCSWRTFHVSAGHFISVSNAILCCIFCVLWIWKDIDGYGDCTHNPLGKDCKN